MSIKLALAGDTMVGTTVGEELERRSARSFFSPEVVDAAREADLCILNLECCISARGERWPTPGKPFFFRAPPRAVEILSHLGVDCVNLANNHSLDYGHDALLDTFEHLASAGIQWVGAGADLARARAPVVLHSGPFRLAVLGVADHPPDYAAALDRPGTAFADLHAGVPQWLEQSLATAAGAADAVLFTPHWGPNFTAEPPAHVRSAAARLHGLATLVAGHSAHVIHGVEGNVLYDLGDFLETYPGERAPGTFAQRAWRRGRAELRLVGVEVMSALGGRRGSHQREGGKDQPFLRRQLKRVHRLLREARADRLRGAESLLFLVTLDEGGPKRLEALPLQLRHCHTRLAQGEDAARIKRRFRRACRALGTPVIAEGDRLVITWQ
jgi:hypothetical protein